MPNFITQNLTLDTVVAEQSITQSNNLNESGHYIHVPATQRGTVLVTVNVYDGPDGIGYEISGQTEISGETWERVIHVVGAETWREQAWKVLN